MARSSATAVRAEVPVVVRGSVSHLFFSGPTFSAGVLATDDDRSIRFAGRMMVLPGDAVILRGAWKQTKYGKQLDVSSFEYDIPLDAAGFAHYLATNPRIKGIGPTKAKAIAAAFGDSFESALLERPEEVARAAKVPLAVIETLREEWTRTRVHNTASVWLASFELTHHQIATLVKKYGNSVVAIFKDDPFTITREIPGYGFKRVDKIARKMGTPKDHPSRIRSGILACVNDALDDGHCWTDCKELVEQANMLLVLDTLDSREIIERALDQLIADKELTADHADGRFLVSLPAIRRMEFDLAEMFRGGDHPNPHFPDGPGDHAKSLPAELNEGQRRAVLLALAHAIVVITGGAGTGKTFTIKTLCDLYARASKSIVLCAPTGKAAKRMEEATGRPAMTIHRLLGYDGREFQLEWPLPADLLVLDETSMVSVPLCWHLLRSVDLSRTAVVLVGDPFQLLPVECGAVLRDLVTSQAVPVARLDQVVRQAGILKENCAAILKGVVAPSSPVEPDGLRSWYRIAEFTGTDDLIRFILALYEHKLHDELHLDLVDHVQLLSPTRKGPLGVNALNIGLQSLIQRKLFGRDVAPVAERQRPRMYPGDKIIVRRNSYRTQLMNGTWGRVISVDEAKGELTGRFDGREVTLSRADDEWRHLDLGYCNTVHQVQGSEFPVSIVLVSKQHSFQHNRSILYTACTRARRSVVILGDAWGIRNCATKVEAGKRRTWLSLLFQSDVVRRGPVRRGGADLGQAELGPARSGTARQG